MLPHNCTALSVYPLARTRNEYASYAMSVGDDAARGKNECVVRPCTVARYSRPGFKPAPPRVAFSATDRACFLHHENPPRAGRLSAGRRMVYAPALHIKCSQATPVRDRYESIRWIVRDNPITSKREWLMGVTTFVAVRFLVLHQAHSSCASLLLLRCLLHVSMYRDEGACERRGKEHSTDERSMTLARGFR